ncbi:hypothetical protein F4803DRAFT_282017 [Xylaria telfairii]|nr:hypothetical protein F4803DRAFT_282017 [Xylaria telfairii]
MASRLPRLARLIMRSRASQPLTVRLSSTFQTGPSPPRLPASEQAEFERLQRTANTQEGFNATSTASPTASQGTSPQVNGALRKGAPPEFEGDVNPRTGEVGGPKNEPLRWGAGGDYSFNGRVTDF